MSTIFKKIIDREIKSEIVYEDKNVICINDINPQAPTHLLIIPKKISRQLTILILKTNI